MVVSLICLLALVPIAAIAALVALAYFVGRRLPENHEVRLTRTFPVSPEVIWSYIADPGRYPVWRGAIVRVEMLDQTGAGSAWREIDRRGETIPYEQVEVVPSSRLVTRIATESLPYGGSWAFDLAGRGDGTDITITERGVVRNPFYRFMSRYILGQESTISRFLGDLDKAIAGRPTSV